MSPILAHWLLAFAAATIVSLTARARRSLSFDGTLAATATGTILIGTTGWWAGLLLVVFFASSSLLSQLDTKRSAILQARGSERDAVQVLANGGAAILAAIVLSLSGNGAWTVVAAGAIAGANADTWSTEIGRRSRSLPRLITTGRTVPAGTSGAISRRGLLGAIAGGALIGAVAAVGWWTGWLPGDIHPLVGLIGVTLGGLSGSLWDSLMGATVQDQRWCDTCQKLTEQRVHHCGTMARNMRGFQIINNDIVNFSCTVIGGGVAWIVTNLVVQG